MFRNESGLFYALEMALKKAKQPKTCIELYDEHEDIRELAASPNRVSDYLGGLWRRGLAVRVPAPKSTGSSARWAYAWKKEKPGTEPVFSPKAQEFIDSVQLNGQSVYKRGKVDIRDNGNTILIDLPALQITIQMK